MKTNTISEYVIRVRSEIGQNRIVIGVGKTFGQLKNEISQALKQPISNISIHKQNAAGPVLNLVDSTKIYQIPNIEDGFMIFVNFKQKPQLNTGPSQIGSNNGKMEIEGDKQEESKGKCNHGPLGKCINCLGGTDNKLVNKQQKTEENQGNLTSKCSHGPNGKCIHCIGTEEKHEKSYLEKDRLLQKMNCQHGPGGKCIHCMDTGFVTDTKHVSFDEWLYQKKIKCKGQHPPESKCNNCLPPQNISLHINKDCKNHAPYPQAQCGNCLPKSVVLANQPYRHIDYTQIMNFQEVNKFVQNWKKYDFQMQQVGFLLGYYAEDPNYRGGVRAIVECIYYPPQIGDISGFQILNDDYEYHLNLVTQALTLEKIGWVYTTINHDTFMTSNECRLAAQFQERFKVPHATDYQVSKFVTIVLRTGKEVATDVQPECYMISDQGQVMEAQGIFGDSENRKMMHVIEAEKNDVLAQVIKGGKEVHEFESDYLLVNIANGYRPDNKFSIIKFADFPVENRSDVQTNDIVQYFNLHKEVKTRNWEQFSDFHLLLYLSKFLDEDMIINICDCIANEKPINENTIKIIKQYLGF